jgi:hypothetical protein
MNGVITNPIQFTSLQVRTKNAYRNNMGVSVLSMIFCLVINEE